jgi:hypothetical protein
MKQASVISLSGDAITIFKEIQCLTPRYVCFCLLLDVVYMGAYDCTSNPVATYLHARVKNANFMLNCPCILDKQIRQDQLDATNDDLLAINYSLTCFEQHPLHSAHISPPDSTEPQQP